jgi:N-acetylneuraminic acid mutarotase
MRKSLALLLALAFLTASCVMVAKPVVSSADTAEDSWASKAPMHVARSDLGVAVVGGKIYAIGGSTGNDESSHIVEIVSSNEEYDPVTDAWIFKKSMPTARYGFAIAVYQNKIYCIGGVTSYSTSSGYDVTGINEVYDPATDTWETKTPMPTARDSLQANVVNDRIYLIGGYLGKYNSSNPYASYSTLNEVYNPATDSWTTKIQIPTVTMGYASAVVNNQIYIIKQSTQIYDAKTDAWSYGEPIPSTAGSHSGYATAAATTGVFALKRIYLFSQASISNQIYNPDSDSWTAGADLPTKRGGAAVAVVNDMLYVIGGKTYDFAYPDDTFGVSAKAYAVNEQYTPFGYGTIPPVVQVVSLENMTYASSNVSLAFTVNKQVSWMGYSLDGLETVAVTGNTTLTGLQNGLHNVTVYAKDTFENTGASETVYFSVEVPFPTTLVVAPVVSVAVIGAVLAIYLKKRKH